MIGSTQGRQIIQVAECNDIRKWPTAACMVCVLLMMVAAASLQAQPTADSGAKTDTSKLTLEDLRNFTDVFNQVRRNYVEEVDDRALLEAAIGGMLADLDPHSSYLPSDEYEDLENSSRGQYVGLGVDVAAENGRIVVKRVIVPSPADTAGIDPGDIITAIDGNMVKGRLLTEAIDDLSGLPGSTVEIAVLDENDDERTLVLKRELVKVPAMSYRLLEGRYGYFRLVYFHRDSATDLKNTLDSIQAEGTQLRGIVLDLRDNPGGVLQPAVEIANGFLDQGNIVSTRGRNASMQMEFSASPGQWLPDAPMVILVDRGSASASEVLAGALQDHKRALIVGEPTFGKGSVQSVLQLRNGAGLKLTTARYYTPSGRSIQATGIQPDILVANEIRVVKRVDERPREADLQRHLDQEPGDLPGSSSESVSAEEDFPLFEALNILRASETLSVNEDGLRSMR